MLPRPHRVKTAEFQVVASGRVTHSPHFSLRVVDTKTSDPTKVAFVVSAKVARQAVARNRLKRRAREIVGKQKPELLPGLIVAVYFKAGAGKLTFAQLEAELNSLFKQARVV